MRRGLAVLSILSPSTVVIFSSMSRSLFLEHKIYGTNVFFVIMLTEDKKGAVLVTLSQELFLLAKKSECKKKLHLSQILSFRRKSMVVMTENERETLAIHFVRRLDI